MTTESEEDYSYRLLQTCRAAENVIDVARLIVSGATKPEDLVVLKQAISKYDETRKKPCPKT